MLYFIDGRLYILANGYYREVTVAMINKEYDVRVKENGDKIEYIHGESKPEISVKEAYEMTHKKMSM